MKKNEIIKQIIEQAKAKKATDIKAASKGYDSPKSIQYRNARSSYKPDLVVSYGMKKDLYTVEERYSKTQLPEMITKWILFSLEARKRKGTFYLVIPEKLKESFEKIVNEKQISAEIMAF